MGKFTIDGVKYTIADETNLNQTISKIRSSDSHIKAQQELETPVGATIGGGLANLTGLTESLTRGIPNFLTGMGTQAGQVASDLAGGEELISAGKNIPKRNKMEIPALQDSSKEWDKKIGHFFEWAKAHSGRAAERIANNPTAALGPAGMLIDRLLNSDKDVPDNNTARSIGEGGFDVAMGAMALKPMAAMPRNARMRRANEVEAQARQNLEKQKQHDAATAAIDKQRPIGPLVDTKIRTADGLAERATPPELRRLNEEFQPENAAAARIQELGPRETAAEIRQAAAESRAPALAEAPKPREGIDFNLTDVRPNLVESIERASNKSTAIKDALKSVREQWDAIEAQIKQVFQDRVNMADEGTIRAGGLEGRPARAFAQDLANIGKMADELQSRYSAYLSKYDQRKLQFYREKAERYRRDIQGREGPSANYGETKVYPDRPVTTQRPNIGAVAEQPLTTSGRVAKTERPYLGNPKRSGPGGRQRGAIDRDLLTLGLNSWGKPRFVKLSSDQSMHADRPVGGVDNTFRSAAQERARFTEQPSGELVRDSRNSPPESFPELSPEFKAPTAPDFGDFPPITSNTPRGRQSGAVNFGGKPTLEQYRRQLERLGRRGIPDPVLREMYNIEHGKPAMPPAEVSVDGRAAEASQSIVGIQDYRMELKPVAEMVSELSKSPDINTGPGGRFAKSETYRNWKERLQDLQSSLSDTARTTNNPTLRAVYSVMEKVKQDVSNHIKNWLEDANTGILPSSARIMRGSKMREEAGRFWKDVVQANEGKRWVPSEELKAAGWSPDTIKFYENLQSTFKTIIDKINEVRATMKDMDGNPLPPIKERPGYFPGQFAGRYQVNAWTTIKGKKVLIGRFGAGRKSILNDTITELQKKYPDYEFGKVEQRNRARGDKMSEVESSQYILEDLMGRFDGLDPRIDAARSLVKDMIAQNVERTANAHQHFKSKKGIQGTLGFDPLKDGISNFKDGIRAATFYAEQMANWIEVNRHDSYVRAITDPTTIPNQVNAQHYALRHWDTAMRRDIGQIGKTINTAVDAVLGGIADHVPGVSVDGLHTTARAVKSAIMLNFFGGYNLRYLGTQLVQPLQASLPAFAELAQKGVGSAALVAPSLLKGVWDSNMYFLKGKLAPELQSAIKWAETHDIVKPHFIEEMRTFHKDLINNRMTDLISGAQMIRMSEQVARTQFYFGALHYLRETGMRGTALYEAAGNLTNIKMVDYRPNSKPLVFQRLGVAGDMLSPLATFKMNYLSQMGALFVEATRQGWKPGAYAPLGIMLAATYLSSGLTGLVGREDYDRIIHALESAGIIDPFSQWKIEERIYDPSRNKDFWSKSMNFGALSAATGQDISLSFAAPSLTNPSNFTVIPGKIIDTAAGAKQSISERSMNPLLNQIVPQGGPYRWAFEEMNTRKNGDFIDPKDPQRGVKAHRTDDERIARMFGTRSIPESITSHRKFLNQQREMVRKEQYMKARDTAIRKIREGEEFPQKEIDKLLQLGANRTAINSLYETAGKKDWTPTEQVLNRRSRSLKNIEQQRFLRGER